jgi:dTDP-4-amino-4,6-dideoxygalactose transaminase
VVQVMGALSQEEIQNKSKNIESWRNMAGKKYQISTSGVTNSRMDEIQVAYIHLGFEEIQINNQKRRNVAKDYHSAFGLLDLKIQTKFDLNCVSHLFVIALPNQQIRKIAIRTSGQRRQL